MRLKTIHRRSIVMGPKIWETLRGIAHEEERSISDLLREGARMLIRARAEAVPISDKYDPVADNYKGHRIEDE